MFVIRAKHPDQGMLWFNDIQPDPGFGGSVKDISRARKFKTSQRAIEVIEESHFHNPRNLFVLHGEVVAYKPEKSLVTYEPEIPVAEPPSADGFQITPFPVIQPYNGAT